MVQTVPLRIPLGPEVLIILLMILLLIAGIYILFIMNE